MKNWHPISLLTTDYKILTRTLASRLQNVLASIISPDQTACIPGRTINDNVALLRDVINYANDHNHPLALVSIDQVKAFDRVSHSFLFNTLQHFGFGPTFIKWIKLIYTQVSSSVKVNGWLTAYIPLQCGLRQGCALSMPLYVLTAEFMAIQIRSNPNIRGILPPGGKEETKLSQYVDDTNFILSDFNSIYNTFKTLEIYEQASGAKINASKCKGLWSGSLRHCTKQLFSFEWINDCFPDPILGSTLGTLIVRIRTLITALNPCDLPSLHGNTASLVIKAKP